jgi:DNA-binding MarR family transcriptional regulator
MTAQKVMFAALPLRAIGDTRLSALELRILGCVAFHDRMSGARGKGQGAWASNETLARRVQCHYTNLSSAITKLAKLGYIQRDPHPLNKKLRVYRVIYDGEVAGLADPLPDDKVLSGGEAVENPFPTQGEPAIVGYSTNEGAGIVCLGSEKAEQSQSQDAVEYISLSDVRYSAEAGKDTHHKMRDAEAPRGLSKRVIYRDGEPATETCAKFERDWKQDWTRYRGKLQHWRDFFYSIAEEAAGEDPKLSMWAQRLSEMIDLLGWETGEIAEAA